MNKDQCIVVIPIHSLKPSAYEIISFRQCFKILGNHPIKVIAPRHLDITEYKKAVPDFEVIFIAPSWLASLKTYNKLKYSRYFYNLFNQYDFILTYELDAFVFFDRLNEWCNKNYDYIGAPWFEGFDKPHSENKITGVGNSGFSLRKTKTMQKVLKTFYYKNPKEYNTGNRNKIIAIIKYPYRKLMNMLWHENYTLQYNYDGCSEDRLFCVDVAKQFPLHIAPIDEAIKFSFEVNPDQLFKINKNNLPMGCHAWWKYNFDFWKPFVQDQGYHL